VPLDQVLISGATIGEDRKQLLAPGVDLYCHAFHLEIDDVRVIRAHDRVLQVLITWEATVVCERHFQISSHSSTTSFTHVITSSVLRVIVQAVTLKEELEPT
jgi:hypothetical protein